MIGYIKGCVIDLSPETVIVEVGGVRGGVGYELQCSVNTLDACTLGDEVALFVQTHMREDALTLFGFASRLEKNLFLSLVKVNGVGPKLALKALSAGPLSNLIGMIESGDVKGLSALPKVGKKTAEQIILTLRGKLEPATVAAAVTSERPRGSRGEIVSALVNLGFRLQEVEKAVESMPPDIQLQDGIRRGLAALSGQF